MPCSYKSNLRRELSPGGELQAISAMFEKDMLAFEGQPRDVLAIRELLVSPGYFGSVDAFNTHMRAKLVGLLSEHFA